MGATADASTTPSHMEQQATLNARTNAKVLRVGMTDGERRLWSRLRSEQLGVKFRRQHPLGSYVLDFVCLDPKLAIEIDGSQHLDQSGYDERRDSFVSAQGFRVLRFWANEVLAQTDAVVMRILDELGRPMAPTPTLPQRGREQSEPSAWSGPAPTPTLPRRGREQDDQSLGSTQQRTDK
jgi:very-short-patch-repair endonuclease